MNNEEEFIKALNPLMNEISDDGLCFMLEIVSITLRNRLKKELKKEFEK
jgi:hypothetical protein